MALHIPRSSVATKRRRLTARHLLKRASAQKITKWQIHLKTTKKTDTHSQRLEDSMPDKTFARMTVEQLKQCSPFVHNSPATRRHDDQRTHLLNTRANADATVGKAAQVVPASGRCRFGPDSSLSGYGLCKKSERKSGLTRKGGAPSTGGAPPPLRNASR